MVSGRLLAFEFKPHAYSTREHVYKRGDGLSNSESISETRIQKRLSMLETDVSNSCAVAISNYSCTRMNEGLPNREYST
jgi:hypothetical protein